MEAQYNMSLEVSGLQTDGSFGAASLDDALSEFATYVWKYHPILVKNLGDHGGEITALGISEDITIQISGIKYWSKLDRAVFMSERNPDGSIVPPISPV